jgi:hypothetical protein
VTDQQTNALFGQCEFFFVVFIVSVRKQIAVRKWLSFRGIIDHYYGDEEQALKAWCFFEM